MKRMVLVALIFCLVPLTANALIPSFGAGVFFGVEMPLVQDDQAKGSTYGFRGVVKAIPSITFEPHITFAKYGDPTIELGGVTSDLEGSDVTGYGVNAVLGAGMGAPGLKPFFFGGIGFYKATRDQTAVFSEESTDFGWSAGLGVGIGLSPMLGADLRGQLTVIPSDEGGSKKSASITGGVTYFFGAK